MPLTLLLFVTVVPLTLCAGALLWALRPREEELVVAAAGFVVARE